MGQTKIEWATHVWNPISGCTPVSEGCQNCYARRMAYRLRGRCGYPEEDPFKVTLHPELLNEPLHWKKPRRVFVCSMGDLFHEDVPEDFILEVFLTMVDCPKHIFMVLTKRPKRMKDFIEKFRSKRLGISGKTIEEMKAWPNKRIWLGVTAENQRTADERIPILLQTPAVIRFVSCEPLLGPIDLSRYKPFDGECYCQDRPDGCKPRLARGCPETAIDWVIVGGETGPNARPMHPDWVRSLRDQCQKAGVPFFFKSWGEWIPSYKTGVEFELSKLKDNEVVMSGPGYGIVMKRVGKKKAGRLLDGKVWNEFPEQ